jgi:penicillin-binding protein 2
VQATRGFSRFYPTGPAVAHLVGYVGTASPEQYEAEDKNPLLITPGFKVGKAGLETTLEQYLRGSPGGQRVEVTARGRLVKELDPKPDRSGAPSSWRSTPICRNSQPGEWARNPAPAW